MWWSRLARELRERPAPPPDEATRRIPGALRSSEHSVVIVLHMVVVPYGAQIISGKDVRMHHPAERLGNESSPGGLALLLGRNTQRSEYRPRVLHLEPAVFLLPFWNAPIHMAMPARDAERHSLVELFLGCAL